MAMRDVEDLVLENISLGLREAQRYLNASLASAFVALLVVLTGKGAAMVGVEVQATYALVVTLAILWVAGLLSAATLQRVDRMLVDFSTAPTVLAVAFQLPVLITAPGPRSRYVPVIAPPSIALIALIMKGGYPWWAIVIFAVYVYSPFVVVFLSVRGFKKHVPLIDKGLTDFAVSRFIEIEQELRSRRTQHDTSTEPPTESPADRR